MAPALRALRAVGSRLSWQVSEPAAAAGQSRGFFGLLGSTAPPGLSMTEPFPDVTPPVPAALEAGPPGTQMTTLPSGVRIASEASWGPTATLGVYVDAGRY
eukprot:scaffold663602_cov37-Prasinocladus_malaysianus.AAC.1